LWLWCQAIKASAATKNLFVTEEQSKGSSYHGRDSGGVTVERVVAHLHCTNAAGHVSSATMNSLFDFI